MITQELQAELPSVVYERQALLNPLAETMGYVDGLDSYEFVRDNPTNYIDPNGTDAGVTGGPGGHTGFIVEVRDSKGNVVGILTAEFSSRNYMGGAPIPWYKGNEITGIPSHVLLSYNPGPHPASAIVPGSAKMDNAAGDSVLGIAGMDIGSLARATDNFGKAWSTDVNLPGFPKGSPTNYYNAGTNNCNHFTLRLLSEYLGKDPPAPGDPPFLIGDALVDGLHDAGLHGGVLGDPINRPAPPSPPPPPPPWWIRLPIGITKGIIDTFGPIMPF